VLKGNRLGTATNNSGGVQGGISNSEPIVIRVAFKPPATIGQPQQTCTYEGTNTVLEAKGRHDPCVVPRAVPIVEAMASLVLADAALMQLARSAAVIHSGPDRTVDDLEAELQLEKTLRLDAETLLQQHQQHQSLAQSRSESSTTLAVPLSSGPASTSPSSLSSSAAPSPATSSSSASSSSASHGSSEYSFTLRLTSGTLVLYLAVAVVGSLLWRRK